MEIESIVISAFVTMFSLGLLVVSLASYRRHKNLKLLFVSFVFLVFLLKGILLSIGLFFDEIVVFTSVSFMGVFDVFILVLLFVATLKRQSL